MDSYSKNISMTAVKRLPRYYRYFQELERRGYEKISSKELSKMMGLTASQIRQDLNAIGAYGKHGYGYRVSELRGILKEVLGLDKFHHCILIGAGNLGQAIANHERYQRDGIVIDAIFDVNPESVRDPGDSELHHADDLEDYLANHEVDIAILTVPAMEGQKMADRAVAGGVKGILNFVPIDLKLPPEIMVSNVNITENFLTLTFLISEKEHEEQKQKTE